MPAVTSQGTPRVRPAADAAPAEQHRHRQDCAIVYGCSDQAGAAQQHRAHSSSRQDYLSLQAVVGLARPAACNVSRRGRHGVRLPAAQAGRHVDKLSGTAGCAGPGFGQTSCYRTEADMRVRKSASRAPRLAGSCICPAQRTNSSRAALRWPTPLLRVTCEPAMSLRRAAGPVSQPLRACTSSCKLHACCRCGALQYHHCISLAGCQPRPVHVPAGLVTLVSLCLSAGQTRVAGTWAPAAPPHMLARKSGEWGSAACLKVACT